MIETGLFRSKYNEIASRTKILVDIQTKKPKESSKEPEDSEFKFQNDRNWIV